MGCEVKVEISKLKEEIDSDQEDPEPYHLSVDRDDEEDEEDSINSADICQAELFLADSQNDDPLADKREIKEKVSSKKVGLKIKKTGNNLNRKLAQGLNFSLFHLSDGILKHSLNLNLSSEPKINVPPFFC